MSELTKEEVASLKKSYFELKKKLDAATGAYKSNMQAAAMPAILSDKNRCLELRNEELQEKFDSAVDVIKSNHIDLRMIKRFAVNNEDLHIKLGNLYGRNSNWLKQNTNTSK